MESRTALLAGASLGAGVMYFFDPESGARRRAEIQNQLDRFRNDWRELALVTARDIKNRTIGVFSETRARLSESEIDDEVLLGRARSKLGFLVRHPSAIETAVREGRVSLRGPVLADEVEQLIDGVRAVRGVKAVENQLQVHNEPGSVPGLQGEKPRPAGQRLDIMQRRWSPATRFLIGAGSAFLLYKVSRTNAAALVPGSVLLGLTALGATHGGSQGARHKRSRREARETVSGWSS